MSKAIKEWQDVNWTEGVELRSGPMEWGLVDASPNTEFYWSRLKSEKRVYLRCCNECGTMQHARRVVCQKCYGAEFTWIASSGKGSIYTKSTIEYANDLDLKLVVPYSLGIVLLDEQVPIFTRIVTPGDLSGRKAEIGNRGVCGAQIFLGLMLPLFEVE